jgi:hypothetical protein
VALKEDEMRLPRYMNDREVTKKNATQMARRAYEEVDVRRGRLLKFKVGQTWLAAIARLADRYAWWVQKEWRCAGANRDNGVSLAALSCVLSYRAGDLPRGSLSARRINALERVILDVMCLNNVLVEAAAFGARYDAKKHG